MKRIKLQEHQVSKIFEDYRQLKLPFERGAENGYDYKGNYEHFIDWLEYIGKYGTLGNSGFNEDSLNNLIYSYLEKSFDEYVNQWDNGEQACYSSIDSMFNEARKNNTIERYFVLPTKTLNRAIRNYSLSDVLETENVSDYFNFLTKEGAEEFRERCIRYIESVVIKQGLSDITLNERGLIYAEREITLPDMLNTKFDADYEPHMCNYFDYLRSKMKGVGVCWSWEENGGESYCAHSYNGINSSKVLLVGWVNPKSVDWVETLSINTYMENSETELRLLENSVIEVDKILFEGKNILKKPILVKT